MSDEERFIDTQGVPVKEDALELELENAIRRLDVFVARPDLRVYCQSCGIELRARRFERAAPWPSHCGQRCLSPLTNRVRVADGLVAFAKWAAILP